MEDNSDISLTLLKKSLLSFRFMQKSWKIDGTKLLSAIHCKINITALLEFIVTRTYQILLKRDDYLPLLYRSHDNSQRAGTQ